MTSLSAWALKIGAVAVFLLGVYLWGHHMGAKAVQSDWNVQKTKDEQAQIELVRKHGEEVAAIQKKHDQDNQTTTENYQRAIDENSKKYDAAVAAVRAHGLRLPASVCPATGPTETASATSSNAPPTGTIPLPDDIANNLLAEARRADEVTEQARACQSWITLNGFYAPPLSSQSP